MKTILLSLCLLVGAMNVNAFTPDTDDPKQELTKQLSTIVSSSSIWNGTKENHKLIVSFTINDNNELVILSTNDSDFDFELKGLLNYRKMNISPALKNKIFHLPIRIESKA